MENFDVKDFYDNGNLYLIPSYLKDGEKELIKKIWINLGLNEHVYILSSGTSSGQQFKSYAISKEAIIANARCVNAFLNSNSEDSWLSSLPYYHIGGLSIFVRAFESGSRVIQNSNKWNVHGFMDCLVNDEVSFTSLVPTQLYDLVQGNFKAPLSLKGIFVGGDFLDSKLKEKAIGLNWPLIQTYGMTETSSQIATSYSSKIEDEYLEVLGIHNIIESKSGYFIESPCLFSKEIIINGGAVSISDCDKNMFQIKDNLSLKMMNEKQFLRPLGRIGDEIKVKGRLYSFLDLKNSAKSIFLEMGVYDKAEIVLLSDEREGKKLALWLEDSIVEQSDVLCAALNRVLPIVLPIKTVESFEKLPKTVLGKLRKS
jgi:O-succinylbenzoic acid--CoA ligase